MYCPCMLVYINHVFDLFVQRGVMLKYMHDDKTSDGRHKRRDSGTSSKHDEDVDEHYKTLTDKHGDTYSIPQ